MEVYLFLLAIILFFAGYGVIRRIIVSRVGRLMQLESGLVESEAPDVLHEKEEKASTTLAIRHYTQAANFPGRKGAWQEAYENAKALFEKNHRTVMTFSLLYFLLSLIPGIFWGTWPDSGLLFLLYFLLYLYFVNSRRKFRRFNAYFTNLSEEISEVKPSMDHTLILVLLIYGVITIAAFSLDGTVQEGESPDVPLFGYLLLGTLALQLLMLYTAKVNNAGHPNLKLLVLRVFGQKDQAKMTFARLLTIWKHFGTYFTIVDPFYLNYRYRTFSIGTLMLLLFGAVPLIAFILTLFLLTPGSHDYVSNDMRFAVMLIFGLILTWSLIGLFWSLLIRRNFVKNVDSITARLEELQKNPLKLDLTFKRRVLFCHNNTWKHAVYGFISNSDAVLMDLRGISIGKNVGCEFEVDLLMDTFPLDKIIFLVSHGDDLPKIQQFLQDRWEFLRINSPNWSVENPVARIYVSQTEQGNDIVNLIKMLLVITSAQTPATDHKPEELPLPS